MEEIVNGFESYERLVIYVRYDVPSRYDVKSLYESPYHVLEATRVCYKVLDTRTRTCGYILPFFLSFFLLSSLISGLKRLE